MIHIARGTPKAKINSIVKNALYKEKFLRCMRDITIYFNALEESQRRNQKVDYRTEAAREAEKQFAEKKKGQRYDRL